MSGGWWITTSDTLVGIAIDTALLVVLLLVVERVFGRLLSSRWRYALWLLVPLRLSFPVLPPDPVSHLWESAGEMRHAIREQTTPGGGFWSPEKKKPPELEGQDDADSRRSTPSAPKSADVKPLGGGPTIAASPIVSADVPTVSSQVAESPSLTWRQYAVSAWFLLAIAFILRAWNRDRLFRARLRECSRLEDGEARDIIESCLTAMRVRGPIDVLEVPWLSSPAVYGVRRPRLLLPSSWREDWKAKDLRNVALHEMAHIRRGDLRLNAWLTILQSLYWFHPLVPLALRRLRVAQETVRDQDAIDHHPEHDRLGYARTLLQVAENRMAAPAASLLGLTSETRDVKRRILMITNTRRSMRGGAVLGVTLLCLLSWVALTDAKEPKVEVPSTEYRVASDDVIEVFRQSPAPKWRTDLEERLQQNRVSLSGRVISFGQLITYLRTTTGLNFVLREDVLEDIGDTQDLSFDFESIPLNRLLDYACRRRGLSTNLVDGAIYIHDEGEYHGEYDLRFYKVGPLLGDLEHEDRADSLIDLIREVIDPEAWEVGGEIRFWDGLLCVIQNHRTHARLEEFLNDLLRRGRAAKERSSESRDSAIARLGKPLNVSFDETPLSEVVDFLSSQLQLPIVLDDDCVDPEEEITLELASMSAGEVLNWIARAANARVMIGDGVIHLGEDVRLEREYYDVRDLLERGIDRDEQCSELVDLMQTAVAPSSWEEHERAWVVFWDDLMIVSQEPGNQSHIHALLATLRQAFAH